MRMSKKRVIMSSLKHKPINLSQLSKIHRKKRKILLVNQATKPNKNTTKSQRRMKPPRPRSKLINIRKMTSQLKKLKNSRPPRKMLGMKSRKTQMKE
jgi:hypothetical protein